MSLATLPATVTPPKPGEVTEQNYADLLTDCVNKIVSGEILNVTNLIPLFFHFKTKPLTYNDHFVFEPLFNTYRPDKMTWITGRQVGKSLALATHMCLDANVKPAYNILYVSVLQEMVQRFSKNYVDGLFKHSLARSLFIGPGCPQRVLQKTFSNESIMYFSFAFRDCTRIRGMDVKEILRDEYQDTDPEFDDVIEETASGGDENPLFMYVGTPLTTDIAFEQLRWKKSSQAEWVIRCDACNFYNIPSKEFHFEKIIGPRYLRREVSPEQPGIVCAKCGKPIFTRKGQWIHAYPELRSEHSGYHVPQIIMPFHCENEKKWRSLLEKRNNMPQNRFYNEIGGISWDKGSGLLTPADIQAAAKLPSNSNDDWKFSRLRNGAYRQIIMGVDWGGGGQDQVSFTTIAIAGLRADGKVEIFHGWRSPIPNDHVAEAVLIRRLFHRYRCDFLAHDFCGAGATRESLLVQSGVSADRIIPIAYTSFRTSDMFLEVPFDEETRQRNHFQLDKPRSLSYLCTAIKLSCIDFFAYDNNKLNRGLLHDFLALMESKVSSYSTRDIYRIVRDEKRGSDDFAHAVNYAVQPLYSLNGAYPDLSIRARHMLTEEEIKELLYDETEEERLWKEVMNMTK